MQRDGSGCQLWRWDDEYENYLMTKGYVPATYQPIFTSNLPLVQDEGNEVARSAKPMQADLDQILQKMTIMEELGRDIVTIHAQLLSLSTKFESSLSSSLPLSFSAG